MKCLEWLRSHPLLSFNIQNSLVRYSIFLLPGDVPTFFVDPNGGDIRTHPLSHVSRLTRYSTSNWFDRTIKPSTFHLPLTNCRNRWYGILRLSYEIFHTTFSRLSTIPYMLNQMNVRGLLFDPYNNAYIVILRDEQNSDMLPIWVGKAEASAISFAHPSEVAKWLIDKLASGE